eukprot:gene12830-12622_t
MSSPDTLTLVEQAVDHRFAQNGTTRIHVATAGTGRLVLFIHGFPDHWLTWHAVMASFLKTHRVAAMDLRGFNLSDQPLNPSDYDLASLVGDVAAAIESCGAKSAVLVGHDWGGWLAWQVAMTRPDLVEGLVVMDMPHPWAIARELAINPRQEAASAYVRGFQQPGAERAVPLERLGAWVTDPAYRTRHDEAFARTNLGAPMNYYRVHFPAPPYRVWESAPPPVKAPTLIIHGLADAYALPEGLNGVWDWVEAPLTVHAWPGVGHFVQQEQPGRVVSALAGFLLAHGLN